MISEDGCFLEDLQISPADVLGDSEELRFR